MTTMILWKNKMHDWVGRLLAIMHVNQKRAYYLLAGTMGFFPLAFAAYVWMTAGMKGWSLVQVLQRSPYTAIMAIVAFMDISWGYSLWYYRDQIQTQQKLFGWALTAIFFQQMLVGGVFIAGMALIGLHFHSEIPAGHTTKSALPMIGIIFSTILFGFCFWMILRLA